MKKQLKRQSDAVAVAGPFGWTWHDDVPADIVDTIDQLCADVSCLGESDSPVVLDLVAVEPTHALDPTDTAFPAPGGTAVRSPLSGRVDELITAHSRARTARGPSVAKDKFKTDESPTPSALPATSTRPLDYRPVHQEAQAGSPWPTVVLLHVTGQAGERIRVAVATHRALIARLGDAPALLTGQYAAGAHQPANRLAIQYLDPELVRHRGLESAAIALLIPACADAAELAAVERAVAGLTRIYAGAGAELTIVGRTTHDAANFWPDVPAEHVRMWRPLPSLVPETRPQRSARGTPRWTLADAALLSLGYVMRDRLTQDQRATRAATVQAMSELGARVFEPHALADSHPERHAHKVPSGQLVFPYTALMDLRALVSPHTLLAAGQSRHLGGGLLVPEDIWIPLAQARGLLP